MVCRLFFGFPKLYVFWCNVAFLFSFLAFLEICFKRNARARSMGTRRVYMSILRESLFQVWEEEKRQENPRREADTVPVEVFRHRYFPDRREGILSTRWYCTVPAWTSLYPISVSPFGRYCTPYSEDLVGVLCFLWFSRKFNSNSVPSRSGWDRIKTGLRNIKTRGRAREAKSKKIEELPTKFLENQVLKLQKV